MLQGEHSAILLTFIKLPFIAKIFVLSIFERQLYTGSNVLFTPNFIDFISKVHMLQKNVSSQYILYCETNVMILIIS